MITQGLRLKTSFSAGFRVDFNFCQILLHACEPTLLVVVDLQEWRRQSAFCCPVPAASVVQKLWWREKLIAAQRVIGEVTLADMQHMHSLQGHHCSCHLHSAGTRLPVLSVRTHRRSNAARLASNANGRTSSANERETGMQLI